MINNITTIGVGLAVVVSLIYFLLVFRNKEQQAQLSHIVLLLLSSVGVISGTNLGLISVFKDDTFLGALVDQRIPILVGAIAICWVSIDEVIKIWKTCNQKSED